MLSRDGDRMSLDVYDVRSLDANEPDGPELVGLEDQQGRAAAGMGTCQRGRSIVKTHPTPGRLRA